MEFFHRVGSELLCEDVPLQRIAQQCGTPCYVYSAGAILAAVDALHNALDPIDHQICFSVKSNANISLLRLMANRGVGADIVSGGELFRALKAGMDPQRIVYAGVAKTAEEIRYALSSGISMFNVESRPELEAISSVARDMGVTARIALRVNPDVDAHTHAKTTTGKKENKFGVPLEEVVETYRLAATLPGISPIGIDAHLGSPILSLEPYRKGLEVIAALVPQVRSAGIDLQVLDIGGGLGITYRDERPFTPQAFADLVASFVRRLDVRLILEPGRFIAGNAGALLTRIVYVKQTPVTCFYICDAGMNDLIRPAFYDAYHAITPVCMPASPQRRIVDVVGPICESSDVFAKARELEGLDQGEVLAILSAGAYGFSMSSTYNARPRPCEVLVEGASFRVIRRRETYEDLVRGEGDLTD